MTAKATIVADSLAPSGVRLTTMLMTYPTIIHNEVLTHRTMYKLNVESIELDSSKSANSNRAKPTKNVLREVLNDPFCPTRFPKRAASMYSSRGYLTWWGDLLACNIWRTARYLMLATSLLLMWIGVHKQIANRLLMPWTYTTLVITAVDKWWEHFFELRAHYMAQDEVQEVATLAQIAYAESEPEALSYGEWHLPFTTREERTLPSNLALKLSVARCARTSYASTHEAMMLSAFNRPVDEDLVLFERLHVQQPEHAGPKEHQAMAICTRNTRSGNLYGWIQLRHSGVFTQGAASLS